MRYLQLIDRQFSLSTRAPLELPEDPLIPQALVRIISFGINRADLLQRAGYYPPPPGVTDILGLEFAGVIEALTSPDPTGQIKVGQRVMGICAGGGYAEQIIVPRDQLLPIPDGWTYSNAATLPEVYLTAFDALTSQGQLRSGERVLIHAIGSGVGVAASLLANLMGAHVDGSTRSKWKKTRALEELPVEHVWISEGGQLKIDEDLAHKGYDVIIDFIGAAYLNFNIQILRNRGRLVIVGLLGGARAELNLGLLLSKRAQIVGTVLRSRSDREKIELTQRFAREVLPYFKDQTQVSDTDSYSQYLQIPYPSHVLSALNVQEAHELLESNQTWSKVICTWEQ